MPSRLLTSLTAAAVSMFSLLSVASIDAAPVQLTQADYSAAIAGMTTVTEDFEGFPTFAVANPFTIANGIVTDNANQLIVVGVTTTSARP